MKTSDSTILLVKINIALGKLLTHSFVKCILSTCLAQDVTLGLGDATESEGQWSCQLGTQKDRCGTNNSRTSKRKLKNSNNKGEVQGSMGNLGNCSLISDTKICITHSLTICSSLWSQMLC